MTRLLIAAMAAMMLFAVACSSDDDDPAPTATIAATQAARTATTLATPPATMTPAATVATSPVACPVHADICAHAAALEAALVAGDIDAVMGETKGRAVTCAGGSVEPLSPTWTLCEGAAAGEVRYGVGIAGYQSEGRLTTAQEVADFIRKWRDDQTSAGFAEITARTIGCSVADPTCDRAYGVVFATSSGERLLNINVLRSEGAAPEVARALTGLVSLNRELVDGGEHETPIPPFDDPPRPVDYVLVP